MTRSDTATQYQGMHLVQVDSTGGLLSPWGETTDMRSQKPPSGSRVYRTIPSRPVETRKEGHVEEGPRRDTPHSSSSTQRERGSLTLKRCLRPRNRTPGESPFISLLLGIRVSHPHTHSRVLCRWKQHVGKRGGGLVRDSKTERSGVRIHHPTRR